MLAQLRGWQAAVRRAEIKRGGEQDSRKPVLLPKKIDGGPHPKAQQHPQAPQQDDAKLLRAEQDVTESWPTCSDAGREISAVPSPAT